MDRPNIEHIQNKYKHGSSQIHKNTPTTKMDRPEIEQYKNTKMDRPRCFVYRKYKNESSKNLKMEKQTWIVRQSKNTKNKIASSQMLKIHKIQKCIVCKSKNKNTNMDRPTFLKYKEYENESFQNLKYMKSTQIVRPINHKHTKLTKMNRTKSIQYKTNRPEGLSIQKVKNVSAQMCKIYESIHPYQYRQYRVCMFTTYMHKYIKSYRTI